MTPKTTPSSPAALGSVRDRTRADSFGERMELIPVRYYTDAGVEAVDLGSARVQTRAVAEGRQLELIPTLRWDDAG
jgi:hypothetical protein